MHDVFPVLIVALGNPGPEYANTRHNVGFEVGDALLRRVQHVEHECDWTHSRVVRFRVAGRTRRLIYPQTWMNRSGWAVREAVRRHDYTPQDILVLCDCMDLPTGKVRIRARGGAGGHHGLESIIEVIGNGFPRLRVGIGRPPAGVAGVDYVLGKWTHEERTVIDAAVDLAAEAVLYVLVRGVRAAMNRFNGLPPPGTERESGDEAEKQKRE